MINKIVSAGLAAVEQAVLDVAIKIDIPHCGWIPKNLKMSDGQPLEKYKLYEMPDSSKLEYNEKNILESDGTLLISQGKLTSEAKLTKEMANKHSRHCLHIDFDKTNGFFIAQTISAWVSENRIETLNVAGPGVSNDPGLCKTIAKVFETVLYLDMMGYSLRTAEQLTQDKPTSVEDAAEYIIARLPLKDRSIIANMEAEDLAVLHPSLGEYIRNNLGVRAENKPLIESCQSIIGKKKDQEEGPESIIIKEVWMRLNRTHRLRLVK